MAEGHCLETPLVNAGDAVPVPWVMIYIFFRILNSVIEEIGLADQFVLLGDDTAC